VIPALAVGTANQVEIGIDAGRRKRRVAAMNPTQKQFSLNRAVSKTNSYQ